MDIKLNQLEEQLQNFIKKTMALTDEISSDSNKKYVIEVCDGNIKLSTINTSVNDIFITKKKIENLFSDSLCLTDLNITEGINATNIPNSVRFLKNNKTYQTTKPYVIKNIDNYIYILEESGVLNKLDLSLNLLDSINLIESLAIHFNLNNLKYFDICDFTVYKNEIFLSTRREGVFKGNFTNIHTNIIRKKNVNNICVLSDENIVVTIGSPREANVKIYSHSGLHLMDYNNLRQDDEQYPRYVKKISDDCFIVVGVTTESLITKRLLHVWKYNGEWVNIDHLFKPIDMENFFSVDGFDVNDKKVSILCSSFGSRYVLNYDIDNPDYFERCEKKNINKITQGQEIYNNSIVYSGKKIKLKDTDIKDIIYIDTSKLITHDYNKIYLSEFEKEKPVSKLVFDLCEKEYNRADVYIKTKNPKDLSIEIRDKNKRDVMPNKVFCGNDFVYINILNDEDTDLSCKINLKPNMIIEDIYVSKDVVFR